MDVVRGILKEVGFEDEEIEEEIISLEGFWGDSFLFTKNQVSVNGKMGNVNPPQHYNPPSQKVVFET